ncbi:hypothetical protein V1514DRAFT_345883 [Lipomyces japonicus]|uniref:uncharacterized protein n=1 Tax=Lipomyces japonicus TaxID=56871 RepID=UPI0034D0172A
MVLLPNIPILAKIASHPQDKTAVIHNSSRKSFTYGSLLRDVARWRSVLENTGGKSIPGTGKRIAIMGENSYQFLVTLLAAVSLPDTIAVPLCTSHTLPEISYQLNDADVSAVLTTERFKDKLQLIVADREFVIYEDVVLPEIDTDVSIESGTMAIEASGGIILYTSGTSGNPKGVVIPNATLNAQASSLVKAWQVASTDTLLHTLPLHHIHGILNALLVPLSVGATIVFHFPFAAGPVLNLLAHEDESAPEITIYTAVPTVYSRLSTLYRTLPEDKQTEVTASIGKTLHLAMCGSAALPDPLREGWRQISGGHPQLLERYGMTEVGMALSQPLKEEDRTSGSVGKPLPGVHARLVDKDTGDVLYSSVGWESETFFVERPSGEDHVLGEIELSGPTIFKEYWRKKEASDASFVTDQAGQRWFKTGDIAGVDSQARWWIKGRESMDIIKSGGEKISALEIEREILSLEGIQECAVVGLPSEEWGQSVAVVIVMADGHEPIEYLHLKTQLKSRLTGYKIPKERKILDKIPRNQMGKVNKKTLVKQVWPEKFN